MNSQKRSKINQLITSWPKGTVMVQEQLSKLHISRQLANTYVKSGWINRIGEGAYIHSGDQVDWKGGIFAMQSELNMKVHVGAITALELQGSAHFLPIGQGHPIWIINDPEERKNIPNWFSSLLLSPNNLKTIKRKLFNSDWNLGLIKKEIGEYFIFISSPERAILEYLDLVPNKQTLEQAFLLMEGLQTLRPNLVQELLEKCTSIKVKRLFMIIAEKEGLPWINKLNLTKVHFGSGKRVLIKGGKLNKKYNLSMPENDEEVEGE